MTTLVVGWPTGQWKVHHALLMNKYCMYLLLNWRSLPETTVQLNKYYYNNLLSYISGLLHRHIVFYIQLTSTINNCAIFTNLCRAGSAWRKYRFTNNVPEHSVRQTRETMQPIITAGESIDQASESCWFGIIWASVGSEKYVRGVL